MPNQKEKTLINFKKTKSLLSKIIEIVKSEMMILNKLLKQLLLLFLLGVIIGGAVVYNYFNFKNQKNLSLNDYQEAAAYLRFKDIKKSFIPSGIPDVYGQELDISFDEVQDAIDKVRIFGPTYGSDEEKITLDSFTETELERYKKIGSQIACEYCCGVKTLTKEDGIAACGCAHSVMMRGLAAYLIKNHPQYLTNEQILDELIKWKITYFPKQTLSAELDRLIKAGEPGIEQILEEFPDFLPEMVGGC